MASNTPIRRTIRKKMLIEKKAIKEVITIKISTFRRNKSPLCLFFDKIKSKITRIKNIKIKYFSKMVSLILQILVIFLFNLIV